MLQNMNPGLSRRFQAERPVRFEDFSLSQLEEILVLKMENQRIKCSPEALQVAKDMPERALTSPDFGNASEVEMCLSIAKMNYEKRQAEAIDRDEARLLDELDEAFLPQDFDPEFGRRDINCHEILAGKLDDEIIRTISTYHDSYLGAKKIGLNPRDLVPTNFLFKGPSGKCKTFSLEVAISSISLAFSLSTTDML